jgi:hypothetical protein
MAIVPPIKQDKQRLYTVICQAEYNPLRGAFAECIFDERSIRMLSELVADIKRKIQTVMAPQPEDDDPDAPFAMVGAPLKPRPPLNRSSVAVQPEP